MTQDEARKKWCPMTRVASCTHDGAVPHHQAVFNRLQVGLNVEAQYAMPMAAKCIGSECMMWRWSAAPAELSLGYCGLAGDE